MDFNIILFMFLAAVLTISQISKLITKLRHPVVKEEAVLSDRKVNAMRSRRSFSSGCAYYLIYRIGADYYTRQVDEGIFYIFEIGRKGMLTHQGNIVIDFEAYPEDGPRAKPSQLSAQVPSSQIFHEREY